MDDFYTCQRNGPCTREQMQGSQSAAIVQRLDDLMRECRNGHQLRYADLVAVRYGSTGPLTSPFEFKCRGCGTQYTHAQPCDWCEDGQVVAVEGAQQIVQALRDGEQAARAEVMHVPV